MHLGHNHVVRVVNHDKGINARDCVYTRLLAWYTDDNKSRILVRALILSLDRIPRRYCLQGFSHGWQWSVLGSACLLAERLVS